LSSFTMFEQIVCLCVMEFLQRLPFKLVNIMWHSFLCCHTIWN